MSEHFPVYCITFANIIITKTYSKKKNKRTKNLFKTEVEAVRKVSKIFRQNTDSKGFAFVCMMVNGYHKSIT